MKYIIAIIALLCITATHAKPIFVDDSLASVTPADIKDFIIGFLDGFQIGKYANATYDCTESAGVFGDYFAAGIKNYIDHHYLEGSLNVSDALGQLSPISRICYDSEVELKEHFDKYMKHFNGTVDFINKVSFNAMANFKDIKQAGTLLLTEYLTTKNFTQIAVYTGQITSLVFVIEHKEYMRTPGNLEYTEADPLAKDPISSTLWTIFEGSYKFMLNTKMVKEETLKMCNEGVLNMVLLDEKAMTYYNKEDNKNAWFLFSDSLTFTHQIVDGCYHTYKEVTAAASKVKKEVIDAGKIGKNIEKNLYFIISDIMASWSQIWYGDYIHLQAVIGSIVYRVLVFGTN